MINRRFKANRPRTVGSTDMTPRWDSVSEIIEESDVILEVLDARMPQISRNSEVEKLAGKFEKRLLFILNKADLVPENFLESTFRKLKKEGECFIVSSKDMVGTKRLREYLLALGKAKEGRLRIGVVGYPNLGKSSIINVISLKHKTKVSFTAGTTHGPQWINAQANLSIVDSPGVIPLDEHDEIRLALIAAKNVEKIKQLDLVSQAVINLFEDKQPLKDFYKIKIESNDTQEILDEIGRKKGFIKKGGIIDESRTSIQIIQDWQRGNLRFK
jgi:ribosome biogenesis GTPase A